MELAGKHVLIIGLARSGLAAIRVLHSLGARLTLSERKPKEELKELPTLEAWGVAVTDQSPAVFEADYDLAVKNPGVPSRSPMIERLHARGIPVITEVELAYQLAQPQHYLAVTGTNGKTTTTTLLYEILRSAFGARAHLSGNIGIPLCETAAEADLLHESGHYIALEISNFQLVDIDRFHPQVAVILNLTPDHVADMGGLDAYYRSKTRVYEKMTGDDVFLLNADDPVIADYTARFPVPCRIWRFSTERTDTDVCVRDGMICVCGEAVLPQAAIRLVGTHNLQNVLVAVAAAKAVGVSNEIIADCVAAFRGVEHRIEFVRELGGVKYYNDSKGTNTDATITAVRAFSKGVILLVGGFEKGLSMAPLKAELAPVKAVIGYGACGPRLVRELVGDAGMVVADLPAAVAAAAAMAAPGDTVLLSPTTSSFDQYTCFEERGEHFKALVRALPGAANEA